MQFFDLLLVRWIFERQIGHKNYEDFEHPTQNGAPHDGGQAILIVCVHDVVVSVSPYFEEDEDGNIQRNTATDGHSTYEQALKKYWFMDGTPFGIKEEDNCK